jgi:5'-nucleotidase
MKFKHPTLAAGLRFFYSCLFWSCVMTMNAEANKSVENTQVFGRIVAGIPNETDLNGEIQAGVFIADAQLMATQAAKLGRAEIALVNPGSLAGKGLIAKLYPHDVRYDEIAALLPNGYDLVTLQLTAQQLKYVLEQQFAGCGGQTQQRILQVSNGFSFSWKSNRGHCAKIWDMKLTHMDLSHSPPTRSGMLDLIATGGVLLSPNKTYRVTVNEYLAKGGDNFSILKDGLNPVKFTNEIDAVAAYMEIFKFPNASYDPGATELNRPRIVQLPLP